MCKFASFVLTKDQELWLPTSDSHEDIINHYSLHADGVRGPNILRVEIVPGAELKRFSDYREWKYRVDQDTRPAWFDAKADEGRARAALLRRAKEGFLTVDASGCTALTELKADAAKTVYARGCTALTELKADAADYVDASGCTALTELKADAAKTVYASGCSKSKVPPSHHYVVIR
jgi:hypothetical protein